MSSSSRIHPTAIVHPSAKIAGNVTIGPYAIIYAGAQIAEGTTIGPHAVIENATIGEGCEIHASAFVGTAPQDMKHDGEENTRLILGTNCVVRECVTLNSGTLKDGGQGVTTIGNNCFFMAYSHVAHDCRLGNGVIMANSVALAGHVTVGNNVVFGGNSAAHQFVRVGDLAMIGGLSGVDRDIPPFCLAQGNHCELVGLNSVGLRRNGLTREAMADIKKAYKALFLSQIPLTEAIEELEKSTASTPSVQLLLGFLKSPSKRGITRPRKKTQDALDPA